MKLTISIDIAKDLGVTHERIIDAIAVANKTHRSGKFMTRNFQRCVYGGGMAVWVTPVGVEFIKATAEWGGRNKHIMDLSVAKFGAESENEDILHELDMAKSDLYKLKRMGGDNSKLWRLTAKTKTTLLCNEVRSIDEMCAVAVSEKGLRSLNGIGKKSEREILDYISPLINKSPN